MSTPKYESDSMWKKLQEMVGYLSNRYHVVYAYNKFLDPNCRDEQDAALYQVYRKEGELILYIYYKYGPRSHYISIETEPEYLGSAKNYFETVCNKVSMRERTPQNPTMKMIFTDMDIIFDELVKICDCIDEYFITKK